MIEDLPIPFLSSESSIKVLLTAVGVKLPSTFKTLYNILDNLCHTIELDINSFAPSFFHIVGQAKFSLSACESADALPFILGLADPLLPHLDYQVVVGAAVAESQQDLIECAMSFDNQVQKSVSSAVPCLFVFSSSSFDVSQLPACATQIPNDSSDVDVARRVREGFVRCSMEYLLGLGTKCEELYKGKDNPANLATLASYALLLGGYKDSEDFYNSSIKHKAPQHILSIISEFSYESNLNISFEKIQYDKDFPQNLSSIKDDSSFPSEFATALSLANKNPSDRIYEIKSLLRISQKVPQHSRQLLQYAVHLMTSAKKRREQTHYYHQLALLLLLHSGHKRSFMFFCDQYLKQTQDAPYFLLKRFADIITSGNDWCEQHVTPASYLFSSPSVPRSIKNDLMLYLLTYLRLVHPAEKQREIIKLVPSNMEISASLLVDVRSYDIVPPASPIHEAAAVKTQVFIYSPLQKQQDGKRCAAGDDISFLFTLYNPLLIPITFDMITLTATNAIVYPLVLTLPPLKTTNISLMLKAKDVGKLELSGFTFVIQNLTGVYKISNPIIIDVVERLPTLVIKQPFRFETKLVENSDVSISYQLINTSNVKVGINGIKFAPTPAVLTPTSLPIVYPPKVNPPLPPELEPGSSHQFELSFTADHSNKILSFAIEYGSSNFTRSFEQNQELDIVNGPHISNIQVVPLDDHDDFDTNSVTFMIVITNPFSNPIVVTNRNNEAEAPTVIEANDLGTFLIQVERIDIQIDPNAKKWFSEGLDPEHVRKCETTAIKLKNESLTIEEKRQLWTTLFIKKKIQEQLDLRWSTVTGLVGSLHLTHVNVDLATLTLLKIPEFKASFTLDKKMDKIWQLTTNVESSSKIKLNVKLSFELLDNEDKSNCVFYAGAEENKIESPCSFVTSIHCLPIGKILVIGKFYVGDLDAYFVRRVVFPLQ